jgi:hypothetical protein
MKAKAAIVTVFALVLAAAVVCGEQHRLEAAAAGENATVEALQTAAKEVDVTN